MAHLLRHCGKVARSMVLARPTTPGSVTSSAQSFSTVPVAVRGTLSLPPRIDTAKRFASRKAKASKKTTAEGKVDCACARHPWPTQEECIEPKKKVKDCDFDFRKLEVNPYDPPCDCKDPPPAAGCADVGKPKEVCCRTTRQYGCHCEEEEEESCEEEEEEEASSKTCDLDFRKLEVNPYDDPCECHDPPPVSSCAMLAMKRDVCCRTPRPFGCFCESYDEGGLPCTKQKAPPKKKDKKDCDKKKFSAKCL